ncbi:MAG: hypothetical protein IPO27_17625 [Bacteroidetes bacterium]|nr:hypothetical protein [Bacteroidota bacterium]
MRKSILFMGAMFTCLLCYSQGGIWTWVHGNSTLTTADVYATYDTYDPANVPGMRYEASYWQDKDKCLWVMDGDVNWDSVALWQYNPYTNLWRMRKRYSNAIVFGAMGVPSPFNSPGKRQIGSVTWVDQNGGFWVMGGLAGGSDMFRLDTATLEWTYMRGSFSQKFPVYGVQGVPSTTNEPGVRTECNASWVDAFGDLWVFGGQVGIGGPQNDLFRYNHNTNEWTWMKGDTINNSTLFSYGTKGVSATTNLPRARNCYQKSISADKLKFYFFGGSGANGMFSDLWEYNSLTNNWTWVAGSSNVNQISAPPASCALTNTFTPYCRNENKACATDACGNFWIFGGWTSGGSGNCSDVWIYYPDSAKFSYVRGPAAGTGIWGTKGVASPLSYPPGRGGGLAFIDSLGRFFIYGGLNFNDVWKFEIDTACYIACAPQSAAPIANFSSSDTILCEKSCIDFNDMSLNSPTTWYWQFTGAQPDTSVLQNPTNICFNNYGTYTVTLTATNANGQSVAIKNAFINVVANPPKPTITVSNDTMYSSSGVTYQWYFNGQPIPNATLPYYYYTQNGPYYVIITDTNDCASASDLIATAIGENASVFGALSISPNPAQSSLSITWNHVLLQKAILEVYDSKGTQCKMEMLEPGLLNYNLLIENLQNGLYTLILSTGDEKLKRTFVKQ